ncbi:MAG: hypothetical protein ACYC9J_13950 [Sulfuricaulis sp.]
MEIYEKSLNELGWFIPPYITIEFLSTLISEIREQGTSFGQTELESFLSTLYTPSALAAMVTERYPIAPFISEFRGTIAESVESHFLRLDHIAVAGLIPVIEGAGRRLAKHRGVQAASIKDVFLNLASDCKIRSSHDAIGNSGEIESMMDSFIDFTKNTLYIKSDRFKQADKTNRHGILHGVYSDKDYGEPINFYKSIAAVDFLTFISSFDANISWFAPSETERSHRLTAYYRRCIAISKTRSGIIS